MKAFSNSPFLVYGLISIGIALPIAAYLTNLSSSKKSKKITNSLTVIADIGGTNSRFQLVEIDGTMEEPKVIFSKNYSTQSYESFHMVFHQFLEDAKAYIGDRFPNNAVLAVAGPVKNNAVTPSNVKKWGELNGNLLKNEFNLETCIFLNDFEAIAYAVLKLQKKDLIQIDENAKALENEKISILGPGTGLGYCSMVPAPYQTGWRYYIWGGEGGYAAFSPITELQSLYMLWLMKKLDLGYLCTEKAFAGPGIKPIYEFLSETVHKDMEFDGNLSTEEIVEKGVKNQDALCRKVVDFFLDMYATEVGNMVCREKPLSGIYLVGSLTNAVKDYLLNERKEEFLALYHNKDLMKPMVKNVPIYIVTKHNLGLMGAFAEAQRQLV